MWGWILATVLILILSGATAALVVYIVFSRRRADDELQRDVDQAALERETLAEALELQKEDMARAEKELETSDEATKREILARLARQREEIARRAAELQAAKERAASLERRRAEKKLNQERKAAREEKEREEKRKREEDKRKREEDKRKRQEDERKREEDKREREEDKRKREEDKRKREEEKKPPAPAPAPVPAPVPSPAPTKPPTALELKYPHWGWDANDGLRCKKNDNTGCTTGWTNSGLVDMEPPPGPPPTPSPKPSPKPSSGDNPNRIHESALKEMGVDGEQMTNILGMINGPEQSNIHFWQRVDKKSVFGYCENINDDRGITVGIAGFVSKYGFPQRLIKDYGGPNFDVNKCRPGNPTRCDACDWIRSKGEDQKWKDLQWRMYASEYMRTAMKYVPSRFKDNALIKGLALDTMMNAGEFKEPRMWGLKEISNAAKNESDPLRYVTTFLKARGDNFTTGNTDRMLKGRLGSWEKLAKAGKWDMRNIDLCRAAYCSGRCVNC